MAVLTKEDLKRLRGELAKRYDALLSGLVGRELRSAFEGVKGRGSWARPEELTAIDSTDVSLAIADFDSILKEIRKVAK